MVLTGCRIDPTVPGRQRSRCLVAATNRVRGLGWAVSPMPLVPFSHELMYQSRTRDPLASPITDGAQTIL